MTRPRTQSTEVALLITACAATRFVDLPRGIREYRTMLIKKLDVPGVGPDDPVCFQREALKDCGTRLSRWDGRERHTMKQGQRRVEARVFREVLP